MNGDITLRKFRVMFEHLPPGNAFEVARGSGWNSDQWMLWQLESRMRELFTLTRNIHTPQGQPQLQVDYLPHPKSEAEQELDAAQAAYDAQMEQELDALFARRAQQQQ